MKTETYSGEVNSAYGNTLPKGIKFSGSFDAYESHDEVVAAKDELTNDEVVDFRNAQRKNNARQKSMTEALTAAGITKPDPNDPIVVAARMLRDIEKLDMPQDQKDMIAAVLKAKQAA